jgi:hypothetical protein
MQYLILLWKLSSPKEYLQINGCPEGFQVAEHQMWGAVGCHSTATLGARCLPGEHGQPSLSHHALALSEPTQYSYHF